MSTAGQWHPIWNGKAEQGHEWTEQYVGLATRIWRYGVPAPQMAELMCKAVGVACTDVNLR